MNKLLFVLVLLPEFVNAQKIISDSKDPFTNERNILTDYVVLSPILKATGMIQIKDTTKKFYLSFITQIIPGLKVESSDTLTKECKLKTLTGEIIRGKWYGNAQLPIGTKLYNSATYIFSETDIRHLSVSPITDIKTENVLLNFKGKNQNKLPTLCGLLIKKP